MFSKLEKVMGRVAEKLSTNKVLVAIRDGFLVATPLIIVASIFLVVLTSLAIPIVQKVTFLVNILTLGGVAVFIRLISMSVVVAILISIGFTATGLGYWLLIAFLFTVI